MPIDYTKWDRIEDSGSDADVPASGSASVEFLALPAQMVEFVADVNPILESRNNAVGSEGARSDTHPVKPRINCFHCGRGTSTEKKCARCKWAHYCSKECQVADWRDHRKYCMPYASDNSFTRSALALKELAVVMEKFAAVPIFDAGANDWLVMPSGTCASLAMLGKQLHDQAGIGVLNLGPVNAVECEDLASGISLACGNGAFTTFSLPKGAYKTFSKHAVSTAGSIDSVHDLQGILSFPGGKQFLQQAAEKEHLELAVGLHGRAQPGREQPFWFFMVPFEQLVAHIPRQPKMSRAGDAAKLLAEKIQSAPSFRKCRRLFFQLQKMLGVKSVIWLRNIVDGKTNGFLTSELTAVTSRMLKSSVQSTMQDISRELSCSGAYALKPFTSGIEIYPVRHAAISIIKEVWPDLPQEELTKDVNLDACAIFFLTYYHAENDQFVLTTMKITQAMLR